MSREDKCPALWTDRSCKHDCGLPTGHRGPHRCDYCTSILSKRAWAEEEEVSS
jgi:hypothetical protein